MNDCIDNRKDSSPLVQGQSIQFVLVETADFSSLGKEIPNGISQGLKQGATTAGESSKNMANDIKESFTIEVDINSPSRCI